MDTLDKYIEWFSILINAIVLYGGWYILFKKAKPEIDKTKAESQKENASAAESYANAARTYADELKNVRDELISIRSQLEERDKIIIEQKQVIENLKDWAQRLIFQVKSMNGVPVPYDSTKRQKSKKIAQEMEAEIEESIIHTEDITKKY